MAIGINLNDDYIEIEPSVFSHWYEDAFISDDGKLLAPIKNEQTVQVVEQLKIKLDNLDN